MFNVLILLAVSCIAGYLMRSLGGLRNVLSVTTTVTVMLLLLVFGLSIGSNESIISNLHRDGAKAIIIAVAGVLGSVVATFIYRSMQRKGGAR